MNYKTLMDHINVLIWNLKDESTITMANKTLANFFGKDQKYHFLKNNNRNIFSVQENELIFKDNHKVFTEKQKVFTEKWIRDKTGRLRLLAITKVPKLNENGDIASVFCTAIDITEKASLRRALDITIDNLSASEKFLNLNFQEAGNGILLSDKNGGMILFNEALCEMLHFPMDELITINLFDITHPEDIGKSRYMRNILIKREVKKFNLEQRLQLRNGEYIWVNVYSRLANGGHTDYIISYFEDISDKKNAEETIREQQAEIKSNREMLEFNKIKNKFFANISHEFKTPLNLIFATLHLMEKTLGKNPKYAGYEKMESYINIIRQNSYRLLRLVHNLIDLTKMDINDYHLNLKKCDIVSLINQIVVSVKLYMEENKRNFIYNNPVLEREITCDPLNLERILLNLLSNAIKFTRKGDQIILSLKEDNENIIISVKDTGIGIKEDKLGLIFEEFRQVDESYSRENEGSGLGLSITKYLVELHGGSISVKSKYGEGSEFIVKLPINGSNYHYSVELNKDKIEELTNKVDIEFSDIYSR